MCESITAHFLIFASDRMTALLIAPFHKLKLSLLHVLTITHIETVGRLVAFQRTLLSAQMYIISSSHGQIKPPDLVSYHPAKSS